MKSSDFSNKTTLENRLKGTGSNILQYGFLKGILPANEVATIGGGNATYTYNGNEYEGKSMILTCTGKASFNSARYKRLIIYYKNNSSSDKLGDIGGLFKYSVKY